MASPVCVQCGQTLPGTSKLADMRVTTEEAVTREWSGQPNRDGTITVKMCLQCQITRAENRKRPE